MTNYNSYLDEVIDLARNAGTEALKYYRKDYSIEEKEDDSPVTEADYASEDILISGLKSTDPGIIAEEAGLLPGKSEDSYWIVDPLDGTQDFIDKTGEFSIMVGLLVDGEPSMGVVFAPAREKLWYAVKNEGAFMVENGAETRIQVAGKENLEGYVLIASRNHFSSRDEAIAGQMGVKDITRMGSLGIKFCAIAEGRADIVYYTTDRLGIWDCCAPQVILEEAGGEAFDLRGRELVYDLERRKMAHGVVGIGGGCQREVVENLENVSAGG
ncbi:3'(2'),5'-bisphosphate nucleotidase CysQ [Candidatus Bipolaricaulota bacterium]|nr:3'(2'),5'-bisphosphate nucleotidase CysQ [Candidatus Bipolaricaulota bacterium]